MSESTDQGIEAIERSVEDALAVLVEALIRTGHDPVRLGDALGQALEESGEVFPVRPLTVRFVLRIQETAYSLAPMPDVQRRYGPDEPT